VIDQTKPTVIELDKNSHLELTEQFICASNTALLYEHCMQAFPWMQSKIQLFGRRIPIPRLNAWFGDSGYSYSGTSFEAREWTPELLTVKHNIEHASQLTLNSMLANLYRDGSDSMGWHSDDEASLGPRPQIASLSLGASRRFLLRDKKTKKIKREVLLHDGSLLLMLGDTQIDWQHSLPKSTKVVEPRINLTFRLCDSSLPTTPKQRTLAQK
jgi:alkylated DNA repair dioxygenase AlkB